MAEFRLNAVRSDTEETIDYIDLREPITAEKISRNAAILRAKVAAKLGEGTLHGLIDVVPGTSRLPEAPVSEVFQAPPQAARPALYIVK